VSTTAWRAAGLGVSRHGPDGHRYGHHRWIVVLESNTVEIDCDEVVFTPSGGLVFTGTFAFDMRNAAEPPQRPTIAFAAGQWRYAYAATTYDRRPLAAEHWPGYV
jgi:hypothetical protein